MQALDHALQTSSFSRHGRRLNPRAAESILEDWQPRIWGEVFDYWSEVLKRLTTIALSNDQLAEVAQNVIASHIRGLAKYGRMAELQQALTRIIDRRGPYWPKALEQVRQTIHFEGPKIPRAGLEQLHKWEQLLQPEAISERLRLVVSIPPWGDVTGSKDGHYMDRAEERAKALAEECALSVQPLLEHLHVVLQGEQRQGFAFGQRLGQCIEEPQPLIYEALKALSRLDREHANSLVLAAFLGSIKGNHPQLVKQTLDTVANDRTLTSYLTELTRLIRPTLADLHRILHLVETGAIPVDELKMFSYGSVLDHIQLQDFIDFTGELLTHGTPGVWVALEILLLHRYDEPEDWTTWKPLLRKILIHPELNFINPPKMADLYHWQEVTNKLLKEADPELAEHIIHRILEACTNHYFHFEFEHVFQPVLRCTLMSHPDIAWPLLSNALLVDAGEAVHDLTDILRDRLRPRTEIEEEPSILSILPENSLLE